MKIITPNATIIETPTRHRKPFIFHISFSTEVCFFKAQYVQGTPKIPMRTRIDIKKIADFSPIHNFLRRKTTILQEIQASLHQQE